MRQPAENRTPPSIPLPDMKSIGLMLLGSAITAFGIYNIHEAADITEGGILGLELLLQHWFSLSPAVTGLLLTAVCFAIGRKALGRPFLVNSAISAAGYSLSYFIFEHTPRVLGAIAARPAAAAIVGALFVGIGCGLCVSEGGALSGDDALAMALNSFFGWRVSAVYFVSDAAVLLLSLSYIPAARIIWSLLTVVLSGQVIELVLYLRRRRSESRDTAKPSKS